MKPKNRLLFSSLITVALASGGAVSTAFASDGVFSSVAIGGGNQDANVGLLSTKTYFNAANLNGGALTINGVSFAASSGTNPTGTGFTLSGLTNTTGGVGTNNVGGQLGSLVNDFPFGGNPGVFTLTGLTAGQTYALTYYNRDFNSSRVQNITTTSGATTSFDQDFNTNGDLNLLRYTFTASGANEVLNFRPQIAGNTFHFYGFSTEQVFNNNWTSGADWSTAAWSVAQPNAVGANANFTAQGAPTTINLDASRTVGHVRFDGANAWTVSGGNTLTLQADVGGVSVLGATSGRHTISTPVTLNSDVLKTGAGTVVLSGAITDNGRNVRLGAGTLEIANAAAQTSSANFTGGGNLAKSGAGTLTLSGAHTYTGDTVITGGVLKLDQGTLGTASYTLASNPIFTAASNNQILNLAPSANTGAGAPEGSGTTVSLTNGTAGSGSANAYTVNNNQSITYTLPASTRGFDLSTINLYSTWNDEGRDRITINNISYSTVSDPTNFIAIGGSGVNYDGTTFNLLASLNASGGVLAPNVSAIRFNFGSQENNYVGYRELEVVGTAASTTFSTGLPTGTAVKIASGASLDLNGSRQTVASLADSGGSGGSVINSASSTATTLTLNPASGSTTFSGVIGGGGGGTINLTKTGAGTQVLSGASSYSGVTTLASGVLNVATFSNYGVDGSLGNRSAGSDVSTNIGILFRGGTLQYTGSTAQSTNRAIRINADGAGGNAGGATIDASGSTPAATLSFTATSSPDFFEFGGNRTLTLTGSNTGNNTFGMAIVQTGGTTSVTKSGAGTWVLSGNSSYSGATSVNLGTLLVNNTTGSGTGSSTVTVASGATLGGTGTINGAVNVTGVLSPGASIETLGTGALSFANGSTLAHELDSSVGRPVGSDLLKVTGNLSLVGTVGLTLSDLAVSDVAFNVNDVFSLINYTGSLTGGGLLSLGGNSLAEAEEFSFGLNTWRINYTAAEGGLNYLGEYAGGSDSFVNLTVIPEPNVAALIGAFGGILLLLLRRRR